MILALETATSTGSVALYSQSLIGEYTLNIQRTHSERLMPAVVKILEDAQIKPKDLGAIAVSVGPGSFTGLRIGVMTAKAMAWSLDVPLVGVPTLDAMAWNLRYTQGLLCPALSCRRGEFYSAFYTADGTGEIQRQTDYLALPLASLEEKARAFSGPKYWFGDAPLEVESGIVVTGGLALPKAGAVAQLAQRKLERGETEDPRALVPLNVRKSAAKPRRKFREN